MHSCSIECNVTGFNFFPLKVSQWNYKLRITRRIRYICMEVIILVYLSPSYSRLLSYYVFIYAIADVDVSLFPIWLKKISECTTSVLWWLQAQWEYPLLCISVRRPRTDLSYYVYMSYNYVRNTVYYNMVFMTYCKQKITFLDKSC